MSDFANRLSILAAEEMRAARKDPARQAEMFERLAHTLAMTIAMMAGGDQTHMSTLLAGAEAYLNECAARHAEAGRLMAKLDGRPA